MKFLKTSILLIALGLNLASCSITSDINEAVEFVAPIVNGQGIPADCYTALEPAKKCIDAITEEAKKIAEEIGQTQDDIEKVCDPEGSNKDLTKCKSYVNGFLEKGCKLLENDACKDFIAEGTLIKVIESKKCWSSTKDEENETGMYSLAALAGVKALYLGACGKTDSGNKCPLVNYFIEGGIDEAFNNYAKYGSVADNISNNSKGDVSLDEQLSAVKELLPKELMTALGDTCREKKCNKNVVEIDKLFNSGLDAYDSIYGKQNGVSYKDMITKEYSKIYGIYNTIIQGFKDTKCSAVDGGADSGASQQKKITFAFIGMMAMVAFFLI